MQFDKQTVFAFLLIGLILILINTDIYKDNFLPPPPIVSEGAPEKESSRPGAPEVESEARSIVRESPSPAKEVSVTPSLSSMERGGGEEVVVNTELYRAVFSTKGATLLSLQLKNYLMKDSSRVELVGPGGEGNLSLLLPVDGDTLDTGQYIFTANQKSLTLREQNGKLSFVLDLGEGKQISKIFTFAPQDYAIGLSVEFLNLDKFIDGYSYLLSWKTGMSSTEPNFKGDMSSAKAFALQGDVETFDVDDEYKANDWDNPTHWVALRTKYFSIAVVPESDEAQAVIFKGTNVDVGEDVPLRSFRFDLQMPFEGGSRRAARFSFYGGPLDYDILKSYEVGLEDIVDLGPAIFRPFGKFILWSFKHLHDVIPNYGWVIVLFSILIKLVLYPLTRKSYQSMKEMQTLQPQMQELNEKHKDDAQKKQQAVMSLYKDHGINPLGGCIPMVVQMPLLIALFNVFRSTIELRGAEFIWWIHDLSAPDTVAHLPFTVPFYGDTVNILPLFMGVTMFIQQKMSMKDPKQKMMVYLLPVVFTFLFNSFPSGLNLYYALFNVLTIFQEKVVPHKTRTPEELKSSAAGKPKRRRMKHDYVGRNLKK